MTVDQPRANKILAKLNKNENICPFSGSIYENFSDTLISQTQHTMYYGGVDDDAFKKKALSTAEALMSVNPQNELEGMLGAQMIATHTAAMECFKRAMIASVSLELRDRELNQANKLVRSYAVLLESLQRYRGKGESRQKVTVEHVHIHDGAQAIVGNIEPRK